MKPMDLLGCHIELFTQLVNLLARDHVETYMYSNYRPYGHLSKTNGLTFKLSRPICKLTHGPTYKDNGHTCKPYGFTCKTYGTTYRPYGHTWTYHSNQTSYSMNMDRP